MKYLTVAIATLLLFSSQLIAGLFHDREGFIYNNKGTPLFVKVYVQDIDLLDENVFLLNMTQEDENGHFLAIPIKKKKSKDDDDDDDTWVCPYCDRINPASSNTCQNPECVLYRKKGRDWLYSFAK